MHFRLQHYLLLALALFAGSVAPTPAQNRGFRPPSVPLVTNDPYFSVWSPADRLTDTATVHWTERPHPLHSMVRIDGRAYRLMGAEPSSVLALPQESLTVHPTRSIYVFRNDAVRVTLAFLSPLLPDDLSVLSRPVTYLTWTAESVDGKPHALSVYFDNSALLTVNTPDQVVTWSRERAGGQTALKIGSQAQPILAKKGDDLRIDWGYLYTVPLARAGAQAVIADRRALVNAFTAGNSLPSSVSSRPVPARDAPVAAVTFDLGSVNRTPVSRTLLLAYDDLFSIEYFGQHLRPYWRRSGDDADDLIRKSVREFPRLAARAAAFDTTLEADLRRSGGEEYARIGALAYRQALAANKLVADARGGPLLFSKENFSNGCIATVDVFYPMAPQLLLTSPALMKATLVPVLDYAASPRWKFPFAPHDLGTYPKANGQVYGGGERTEENQMPVEESGNMLILMAALAKIEGNARFSDKYWPQLKQWAEYLRAKGLDPENQLSTDDFAGHLAHNVNLSAKAILALRSYAQLCEMRGLSREAADYRKLAEEFARTWMERADDGDHYRLAFDRPGTWSQKYNLVWDQILDYGLFPDSVRKKEIAFYRKTQNRYGLPLDNRENYTKLDWVLWTATLGSPDDFRALVSPVYDFLNDTPDRVPMTDWYRTVQPRKVGFQARPVVGGVFIKLLADPTLWRKWAGMSPHIAGHVWAPIPKLPEVRTVVPTSEEKGIVWRYTTEKPSGDWLKPGFNDASWKEGPGGFGTRGTPSSVVRTEWNTPDLWIRREFEMPGGSFKDLRMSVHHDEDAEIYINGVLAAQLSGYVSNYELIPISPAARATLKPGRNTLAVHVHQTGGGQYIDVGFVEVLPQK